MPPTLRVTDVTRIAEEAARQQTRPLKVIGVRVGGDGAYAEVMVDIEGCQSEPCRLTLGVFRDAEPAALLDEIALKLRQHLSDHRPVGR